MSLLSLKSIVFTSTICFLLFSVSSHAECDENNINTSLSSDAHAELILERDGCGEFLIVPGKTELVSGISSCQEIPMQFRHDTERAADFWTGGYSQKAMVNVTYHVHRFNICSRTEEERNISKIDAGMMTMSICNPNLDPSVKESYIVNAPLTDQEAREAMSEMKKRCHRR